MPRILSGNAWKRVGAPGWRIVTMATRGGRVAADLVGRGNVRRVFARNPAKGAFVNVGTAQDVLGTVVPAVAASLTTALAGANNDLKYTARVKGTGGNSIRVTYVVAGLNTVLSVTVSGNDITVNVATSGVGAATSTATEVRNAVNAHAAAKLLVLAENATDNDGTGVVAAMSFTNLAGGTNAKTTAPGQVNVTPLPTPEITNAAEIRRSSTPSGRIGVVNRSTNRRIRRR